MSVNKVFLLGNAGKDPEIREVQGVKVASFTLATTDRAYTKSDGTQVPERTEWHNIVAWRGIADVCERYVRKGTKVFIIGKLTTRSWDGRDGIKRYQTEVVVDELELLGQPQQTTQHQQQAQQYQPQAAPQYQQPRPVQQTQSYQPAPMPGQQYQPPVQQPPVQQPQYQPPQAAPMQQPQTPYQGPGVNDLPFS